MKVTIPKPCHENWANMTPDEKGRFCQVCSKSVRDFTRSSDFEIMQDLSWNSDICGNFRADQLDRNLSYSFINSLFMKFAVGFVLTSGGLVSAQTQQKEICDVKIDTIITGDTMGKVSPVANLKFPESNSPSPEMRRGAISSTASNQPALFILNGKVITQDEFSQLDPNTIKDIKVLKGISATFRYGLRAINGAIIIKTKRKFKKG